MNVIPIRDDFSRKVPPAEPGEPEERLVTMTAEEADMIQGLAFDLTRAGRIIEAQKWMTLRFKWQLGKPK